MKFNILLILLSFIYTSANANPIMDVFIKDLNPEIYNDDYSEYDQKTAIYCTQLSEVAYWEPSNIIDLVQRLNDTYPDYTHHYKFLNDKKSHTQLLLFGNAKFAFLAFRGTEFTKIKDLILDLKMKRFDQERGLSNLPAGHGGFRRAIINLIEDQKLWAQLNSFLKECSPQKGKSLPLYTTGHSLGAALATMVIEPLNFEGFNYKGTYTFAPPLALSKSEFAEYKNNYHNKIFNIVNYLDYVTRAGKSNRKNLFRVGRFFRICQSGELSEEDEKINGKYVAHRLRNKTKLLKYHQLKGYLAGIKAKNNSNQDVTDRANTEFKCF